MISYEIISTGSKGNAVVLDHSILIDCGVPYSAISQYVPELKVVLLTHEHGDHFKVSTIRKLSHERPTLLFLCGEWMVRSLILAGVSARSIYVLTPHTSYKISVANRIEAFPLVHDVPNFGYKIILCSGEKVFYATDTGNLNGISAKEYDLYLVEANFKTDEIMKRIEEKKESGEFSYEKRSLKYHLSEEKCNNWLYQNMGIRSHYVYMHSHCES